MIGRKRWRKGEEVKKDGTEEGALEKCPNE